MFESEHETSVLACQPQWSFHFLVLAETSCFSLEGFLADHGWRAVSFLCQLWEEWLRSQTLILENWPTILQRSLNSHSPSLPLFLDLPSTVHFLYHSYNQSTQSQKETKSESWGLFLLRKLTVVKSVSDVPIVKTSAPLFKTFRNFRNKEVHGTQEMTI